MDVTQISFEPPLGNWTGSPPEVMCAVTTYDDNGMIQTVRVEQPNVPVKFREEGVETSSIRCWRVRSHDTKSVASGSKLGVLGITEWLGYGALLALVSIL
jgi:hypothetical protein